MSDFIPYELQIKILAWLPVEDLVRYRTVCKLWYSLITNPSFISLHTQNQTSPTNNNNGTSLLLVRSSLLVSHESYSIRFDTDTFQEYKSLDFQPSKQKWMDFRQSNCPHDYLRTIGCVNGVVCLSDYRGPRGGDTIMLWNPTIRKFLTLPKCHYDHSVGFGFCSSTNDFKVVRVFLRDDKITVGVEVFDLRKGCWISVDPKGFRYISISRYPQAYLNGVLHWIGHKLNDRHFHVIVSFDMGTEELGVIELPNTTAAHACPLSVCINVSVLGESLYLIKHGSIWCRSNVCEIWVMKEYGEPESWTKLFTIDFGGDLKGAFGFLRNGEVLVADHSKATTKCDGVRRWRGHELASYDPKSMQVKYLGIRGDRKAFYVDNFVETLALIGVQGARSDVKED